jgi:hypothetical protein
MLRVLHLFRANFMPMARLALVRSGALGRNSGFQPRRELRRHVQANTHRAGHFAGAMPEQSYFPQGLAAALEVNMIRVVALAIDRDLEFHAALFATIAFSFFRRAGTSAERVLGAPVCRCLAHFFGHGTHDNPSKKLNCANAPVMMRPQKLCRAN